MNLLRDIKNLQESFQALLEATYDHFLVTPPFHITLQKAKGQVDKFTGERTAVLKILLKGASVKENIEDCQ